MANNYNNNNDYFLPYHWILNEDDFFEGGVEYFGYLKIIKDLIKKLNINKEIKHLDVGCGDGKALDYISDDSYLISYGIDLSERAIYFARLMCEGKKYSFYNKNLFDIQDKFELITAIEVLEHIDNNLLLNFIKKIHDLLLEDGYFIFSVPSLNFPKIHPGHIQHFSLSSIKEILFECGFKNNIQVFFQHNINYDFRFTNTIILKCLFKLIKNRYYTLHFVNKILSKIYFIKWNHVKTYKNAGRIIILVRK